MSNTNELIKNSNHILRDDEKSVAEMVKLIDAFQQNGKRPFHMYCSVTGTKVGMSQQAVFEKRLAAYGGDIVRMFLEYKSRDARKDGTEAKEKKVPKEPKVKTPKPDKTQKEVSVPAPTPEPTPFPGSTEPDYIWYAPEEANDRNGQLTASVAG